jgi:WD domain, G-beta repeat/WD40-like Beta Propeller Repeat
VTDQLGRIPVRAILIACCFGGFIGTVASQPPRASEELYAVPSVCLPDSEFKVTRSIRTESRPTSTLAFSPDGRILAAATGKTVHFWDTATGKEVRNAWDAGKFLDKRDKNIAVVAFVGANAVAVVAESGSIIHIRSYPAGEEVALLELGKKLWGNTFTTADGLIALDWPREAGVRIWAGPKWKEQPEIYFASGLPRTLAFSPDRSTLAVGTDEGNTCVYRVQDGKFLRETNVDKWRQRAKVAYSPDGRIIAIASSGHEPNPRTLELWDAGLTARQVRNEWPSQTAGGITSPRDCWFTADGKTVVVECENGRIRLFETQTGGMRHIGQVPDSWGDPTLSPDGRFLAALNQDVKTGEIQLIDWRMANVNVGIPDVAALDVLWADLASHDSAKGFRAVVTLGAIPDEAADLIGKRLKPRAVPNHVAVKAWVADLGSEDFLTREAAEKQLAKFGDLVEPSIRAACRSDMPEQRERACRLLKAVEAGNSPERLRYLRAIEVLEYADTPAGRIVLKTLAGGVPTAGLTLDAKAALARLEARDPKP